MKVTSRRFSEGAETIVSYRASIVANAPEHQQSFDLYMIEKSTESYIEVADVYLDVPYDGNLNPTSLFSQVNSMLFNSYGAFYLARIPAGTPIYVHMSNGYTIVFVKAADGNDTAIEYVVVLDENGYVVDSASNISSTQNSNGVVTYTLGLQAGTYYFTVNEREGIIIITQDPPPKEQ